MNRFFCGYNGCSFGDFAGIAFMLLVWYWFIIVPILNPSNWIETGRYGGGE